MRKCKEKVNTNAAAEITDYIQTREKISIKKIVINNYFHFCYLTMFLFWKGNKNKLKRKSRQKFASAGLKMLRADKSASEN